MIIGLNAQMVVGNEYFRPMTGNSFEFDVGGMQPGIYRYRVQAINDALDKPVKSNSLRFTVSASNDPAWQVGGDFYHIVRLSGGRIGIMIGDVSSHGFPAALIMSLFSWQSRA